MSSRNIHPMLRGVRSGACMTGHKELLAALRTTCRRYKHHLSKFLRRNGYPTPSSALQLKYQSDVKRTPRIHCWRKDWSTLYTYYCTQQASVRNSGGCAGSTVWGSSSSLECHSAQCYDTELKKMQLWNHTTTIFDYLEMRLLRKLP